MRRALTCLLAFFALAAASRADEIRLKDGTKILGTIVGFEDDSFKVQTSYGFALVRKDKIAAILPSEAKAEPKKEAAAEAKKPLASRPAAETASQASAPASNNESPPKPQPSRAGAAPGAPPSTRPAPKQNVPNAEKNPITVTTAADARPSEPERPPIRDEVRGNLYINHTYSFRMYKPPGWEILEGAQTALPSAIVAMGTGDQTTLLVIGREPMKDSLEAHAAATERQLREVCENYRRLAEHRTRIAGLPALVRRFRSALGEHDWSGVVLSFARGKDVFTILGMTYADSDLIQIQENVIARTIASLEFTSQ